MWGRPPTSAAAVAAALAIGIVIALDGATDAGAPPRDDEPTARGSEARPRTALPACRLTHRRFRTHPGFRPVGYCLARRPGRGVSPGYLLLTPRHPWRRPMRRQYAAMIVSSGGRLIWYSPRRDNVHDLKTVVVRGRTLLALYQRRPDARGFYELRDRRYRLVGKVRTGEPYGTNSHELQITPRGTAYVASYDRITVRGVGRVADYLIREIDLDTREVLFEWRASRHVPLRASYVPRPRDGTTWDFFHGNSIEPPTDGRPTLIVSSRNTSAVYGIDRRTGRVRWVLGGKRDQFGLARRRGRRFCSQHDARVLPGGDLTLFDNGGAGTRDGVGCPVHPARVMRFRLDTRRKVARLVGVLSSRALSRSGRGWLTTAVGSARTNDDGNILVNWGTTGHVTEHRPGGRLVLALRMAPWSYRAVRAPWTGTPSRPPAVVARRRSRDRVELWASWNGSTELRRWTVLAGSTRDDLRPTGAGAEATGFETRIRVRTRARVLAVRAHDRDGRVLRRSRPVRVAP